jgi:hypothetical protein
MFATAATAISKRAMSTTGAGAGKKVAVLGASGGIGQPLSLLLKLSPEVGELSCYDVVGTPGVAADLSHVSTDEGPEKKSESASNCRSESSILPWNAAFFLGRVVLFSCCCLLPVPHAQRLASSSLSFVLLSIFRWLSQ